ncbi:Thioredoxin-like fold [Pseudocohnilembus persalinus]|uniref:Thioredoxin-like fold n=1 Tax=Pseudocohnilembus persalinus TaxID=266149 RepID=A0A0V0QI03_PSEPJ|nr:Thioredoxin-like fold [Pseudocohnilembus persalinus]|eukprot:KRX01853.1 Thioredoxin-like fold [Pseudocohnilembus persalinus]
MQNTENNENAIQNEKKDFKQELNKKQLDKFLLFQNMVKNKAQELLKDRQDIYPKYTNENQLVRQFIARDYNEKNAFKLWEKWANWMLQNKADDLLEKDILNELKIGKAFMNGYDKKGNPIIIIQVRKHIPKQVPLDETKKFFIYMINLALEEADRIGSERITLLWDRKGFTSKNYDSDFLSLGKELVGMMQDTYAERLDSMIILYPNFFFKMIYGIFKVFLTKRTKDKIHVYSKKENLLKLIDSSQLLEEHGGSSHFQYNFPNQLIGSEYQQKKITTKLLEQGVIYKDEVENNQDKGKDTKSQNPQINNNKNTVKVNNDQLQNQISQSKNEQDSIFGDTDEGHLQQNQLEEETKNSDSRVFDLQNVLGQQAPILRKPAPQFSAVGYFNGIKNFSLSDFKNQYVILFFFPFDFSPQCHQDILNFSEYIDQFKQLQTQVLGCSVDSQFVHQNYCTKPRSEGGVGGINFPLLSDVNREVSRRYGVMIEDGEEKGASFRATFIIDKAQILRHSAINDLDCSLEITEILRLVKGFQNADVKSGKFKPLTAKESIDNIRNSVYGQNSHLTPGNNMGSSLNLNINGPNVLQYSKRASNAGLTAIQGIQASQNQSGGKRGSLTNGNFQKQFSAQNSNLDFGADLGNRGAGRKRSILKKRNIFDRMGGEHQIRKFVDKLFGYVLEDTRINFFFNNIDMVNLKKHFSDYFIQIFGGPPDTYKGKDLARIHGHLAINADQFEAFCQILEGTLVEQGQDEETIREVFIFIDPMKDFLANYDSAKDLIDRLGGKKIVEKIIDLEFDILKQENSLETTDPNKSINLIKLKTLQKEFYKVALSPEGYMGKSMRELHKAEGINQKNFDKIVKALERSIKELKVEGGSGQEMLVLFEPNLQYKHLPKGKAPLYYRIGGQHPDKVFSKIFKLAFNYVIRDGRIKEYFKNVDLSRIQQQVNHFLTIFFGGPLNYSGKTLRDAHWHLELKDAQFEAFKDCIYQGMREFGVSENLIRECDEIIEPLRTDIVSIVPSLVERCGGEQIIKRVVEYIFVKVVTDKRVKQYFPKSLDLTYLKDKFFKFLVALLGGINNYEGKSIEEAHQEMNLDDVHFNVIKDYISEGLKNEKVPLSIVQEVQRLIESLRHQIVNRHSSLFEKVGGEQALMHVSTHLFSRVHMDNAFKITFKKVDTDQLKFKLVNYLTYLLGGPNNYNGKHLREAHKNLRISDEQFTIFCNYLQQGFVSLGSIDTQTLFELQCIIEAMRGEIISRPATLYERLGGINTIPQCIQVFCQKLQKDEKLSTFFDGKVNFENHAIKLTSFFTMITGGTGPDGEIAYKGPNLKDAHKNLSLSGAIFDRFCKILQNTMIELGAEKNEATEVLNLLESLRTEVIGNKQPTCLDRMGGEKILAKLILKFFNQIEDHQTLASYFRKTNMASHREKFQQFISSAIGGNQVYEGKGLKEAHWRLNLSNSQFNQFQEIWKATMENMKIERTIIKEMLQFWETLRYQVVQRKDEFDEDDSDEESSDNEDEEDEDDE